MGDDAAAQIGATLEELVKRIGPAMRDYLSRGDARGIIIASDLDAIVELLRSIEDRAGRPILEAAQQEWVNALQAIARQAVADSAALGMELEALDAEAVATVVNGQYRNAAAAWDVRVVLPMADRLLSDLTAGLLLEDPVRAGWGSPDDLRGIITRAVTEARTETAMFDRLVTAETAARVDPDGTDLVWLYSGPRDGLQRVFCRAVHDLAWTRSQVARLRNGQGGAAAAIIHGGGYNCRHQWVQVTRGMAERMGVEFATDDDVTRVNILTGGAG